MENLKKKFILSSPKVFPLTEEKDTIYRLQKALYGLKKAPKTWYARLDKYLAKLGFSKGTIDSNLCLKEIENGLLIIIVSFDDIIFGGNDEARDKFLEDMENEFEMSMIGEMNFFLGLQIIQNKESIFISQTKYLKDFLKIFGLENCLLIIIIFVDDIIFGGNDKASDKFS